MWCPVAVRLQITSEVQHPFFFIVFREQLTEFLYFTDGSPSRASNMCFFALWKASASTNKIDHLLMGWVNSLYCVLDIFYNSPWKTKCIVKAMFWNIKLQWNQFKQYMFTCKREFSSLELKLYCTIALFNIQFQKERKRKINTYVKKLNKCFLNNRSLAPLFWDVSEYVTSLIIWRQGRQVKWRLF